MNRSEDSTLLKIFRSQEKMEKYLLEFRDRPSLINPIIWQVHLSAPVKKRMPVLNRFLKEMLKKYSLVFSFLPDHMVLAKVYKMLNIPFSVNPSKTSTVDLVFCKKPKIARSNVYAKIYNSWSKTEQNPELGIYDYNEECPGPFIPYAEFRKECKNEKSRNISSADILSQLSKSKTKEKLVSDFASHRTQFSIKNRSHQIDSRIDARNADQFARKQMKTHATNPEYNRLKKQTLSRDGSFRIFKSKYRPRLDVQLKSKHSESINSTHPTAGLFDSLKAPDSREHCSLSNSSKSKGETVLADRTNTETRSPSSDSLLKILNLPKPCSLFTSSKNENKTVLADQIDIENCPQSKEIQIEADVSEEETTVEQNLDNNESTSFNLNKFSEKDPNQLCSNESVSVIQPTSDENIYTSNSSDPEVVYSSNRSEDGVASVECITQHPASSDLAHPQILPFDEERNSVALFGQPNKANLALSPVCVKSNKSPSSCEHLSSGQSQEMSATTAIDGLDQLYKRPHLEIERKKSFIPLKRAKYSDSSSAFDHSWKKCENNHTTLEISQIDDQEEKNEVSDSETSIMSSKASPSLVYSVIYAQKSSESESDEIDEISSSAVPSSSIAQRDESTDCISGQPASDIFCSQSRNLTSQQSVPKIVSANVEKPGLTSKSSTPECSAPEIVSANSSLEKFSLQSRNSIPEQPVSKIMSASQEMPRSQLKRTTEQPTLKIIPVCQESPRPKSKNSTPKKPISKIMSASKEKSRSQSQTFTPEQPVSKIVPVSPENPRPQSKDSAPEQPVQKIVPATVENSRSHSKSSSPAQSVTKIVIASQEKSRSQTKKPTRKKITSSNSSKAGKESKAKTDTKLVKKLTDYVALSVRKRQASSFELSESDEQTVGRRKKESPIHYESIRRSKSISSPQSHPTDSRKIRKVKKLFYESENYLSPSVVKKPSVEVKSPGSRLCKSPSSKNNDRSVLEKSSDSESSSIILSREFKTLSLTSKESDILFSSQSSKMSPKSTRSVDILNSQAATVFNSQFSTEITLDQVDQMMEGVIPNESTDSSFKFDLPSQFAFKESPNSENYEDEFNVSNFSDILPSSNGTLEETLAANEFSDKYCVSSSDEETVPHRHSSNFASEDTTYPISRSTINGNFSSSIYSLEMASNEDTKDEFSSGKISDSSFSIRKSSIIQKKLRRFLSPNSNGGLPTRGHCLSLPTENKSSRQRKQPKIRHIDVADIDNTSDEDVFRDSSARSLPTQLKKKSTSLSAQQFKRKYCQNKEIQISGKKSQQAFIGNSQKSPLSVAEKSRQFSNPEKKKSQVSSQKLNHYGIISDDDYESDELNTALNDSLTQLNKRKENRDVPESDAESTSSEYFDAGIAQLLTEYAVLNAAQQPLSVSSNLTNTESTTYASTLSVKSNSSYPKSRAPNRKPDTSGTSSYKDIMWNAYPDAVETALTTPEEKLEEVRNNLKEKVNYSNSQKLFSSSQKSKSSRENGGDSFGFLDWE